MKEVIGMGKTVDEATQDALQKLLAKREEVEIEPLETGRKGFLGLGSRPARVRASLRDDDRICATVFLRSILAFMGIETKTETREEGRKILITLGAEASPLIGHRGQTLDALQYLISRYTNGDKEDWRKVIVDIDNYRDHREDNLRSMAERYASQVLRTKEDMKTEPLTAAERRIIHMTLKENPEVTTFSIGRGNRKRIVITTREQSDSAQRRRPSRSRGQGDARRNRRRRPSQ